MLRREGMLVLNRGGWETGVDYDVGNTIIEGSITYICILAHLSADTNKPGVGAYWQTYWSTFCQGSPGEPGPRGLPGTPGGTMTWRGEWASNIQYYANDGVRFEGQGFYALQDNIGQSPPSAPTTENDYWSLFAAAGSFDGGATHAATAKSTPVDADEFPLSDSENGWALRKLTLSNLSALYILKSVLTTRGDILFRDASGPARLAKGTTGKFLRAGSDDPEWATGTFDVAFPFGDGTNVITAQEWGFRLPIACKVVAARIREITQTSGSITCSLYKHALDAAKGDAIDTFTMSSSTYYEETGLTHAFSAGQWATVSVSSITSAKKIVCTLTFEAT